jgi:TetR/AcrR family transcriptional regulator, transcriptional repressor for nem operon
MPYTEEHIQQTRTAILESAFNLFTQKGFEATSIDQIMQGADMTRGAFYAHFSSKSDLYRQALIHSAKKTQAKYHKPEKVSEQSWLKVLLRGYLHKDHLNQKNSAPCPLAFLVTDVAIREDTVREAYTDAYRSMNNMISNYANSNSNTKPKSTLAATAMLIGTVAVARALDDEQLTHELLESCRSEIKNILENN